MAFNMTKTSGCSVGRGGSADPLFVTFRSPDRTGKPMLEENMTFFSALPGSW
jgi:hypothetical protein